MLKFDEESKLSKLNETTINAIEEGRRLAYDKSVKGHTEMEKLKKSLEV